MHSLPYAWVEMGQAGLVGGDLKCSTKTPHHYLRLIRPKANTYEIWYMIFFGRKKLYDIWYVWERWDKNHNETREHENLDYGVLPITMCYLLNPIPICSSSSCLHMRPSIVGFQFLLFLFFYFFYFKNSMRDIYVQQCKWCVLKRFPAIQFLRCHIVKLHWIGSSLPFDNESYYSLGWKSSLLGINP